MEINEELIAYIVASREAGVHEYFIRQALLGAGWDGHLVDIALDSESAWPIKARVDILDSDG
ncbi:MAG: hypothetical protein WD883_00215 [Candidatus Colwellbacteria bacterium]